MMFRNILKYTFKPALCNNVKIKLSLKYIYNIFVLIIFCHALKKYTFMS